MKLREHIRDRAPAYLIYTAVWALILIFMFVFRVSKEAVIIISSLAFLGAAAAEIWDFTRKRSFYNKLSEDIELLDKKYLIAEMLGEPSFLEGRILCETVPNYASI